VEGFEGVCLYCDVVRARQQGWFQFGQTSGVQQQEIFRAKNLPLNYVDKFMEVQRFVGGDRTPKEVCVHVRDAAYPALLPEGTGFLKFPDQ